MKPSLQQVLEAFRRLKDPDGHVHLDKDQALYFDFLFCILLEHESALKDSISLRFAIADLLGVLPNGEERTA